MYLKRIVITAIFLYTTSLLTAQELTGINAELREMSKETDALKSIQIKNRIITSYKLDNLKDSETIDVLNGNIAVNFAVEKNYTEFEKYIGLIKNKFNQTDYISNAAEKLLEKNIDVDYASKLAKETLDKYFSFKDDPAAKPADYTPDQWKRFMDFAKYPYYDTYAKALFAQKNYTEALKYQHMAFDSAPEEGFAPSVERYAKLLELNGDKENSKQLLLKVAKMGKLNKGMIAQLESFYISEKGSNANFDAYLTNLQSGVKEEIMMELTKKMISETAPPFSLKDSNGKQVNLSDYKGKIVILDLWATWCAPCIASFPAMQKEVEKHPDVIFLFIAVQEKGNNVSERVKKFITKHNYPFHVLIDEPINKNSDEYKITSSYKPSGIPAKYFIDKEGKLRYKAQGFDSDSELINEVDAMITILKGR